MLGLKGKAVDCQRMWHHGFSTVVTVECIGDSAGVKIDVKAQASTQARTRARARMQLFLYLKQEPQ